MFNEVSTSSPQEASSPLPEENANLETAILIVKVGCVALAALIVVGFVLAVIFSGAWTVVIPSMVLYAAATMAFPFALHILCEASLGEAGLAAQRMSPNSNRQDTAQNNSKARSKMPLDELRRIHETELRELGKKLASSCSSPERCDLEKLKLSLQHQREIAERNFVDEKAKIEMNDDPKGKSNENPSDDELEEAESSRREDISTLIATYQSEMKKIEAAQKENGNDLRLLDCFEGYNIKIHELENEEESKLGSLTELLRSREADQNQKSELNKAFLAFYSKKKDLLNKEKDLEVNGILGDLKKVEDVKEKLTEIQEELSQAEKTLERLKSELPPDPNSFVARLSRVVKPEKPPLSILSDLVNELTKGFSELFDYSSDSLGCEKNEPVEIEMNNMAESSYSVEEKNQDSGVGAGSPSPPSAHLGQVELSTKSSLVDEINGIRFVNSQSWRNDNLNGILDSEL